MHFVNASIYHKAKQLASKEGISLDHLAHHNDMKEIMSGSKHIPIDLLYDIYEAATKNLEPGFSVRQGPQLNSEDYRTLGLFWRTCWQAKEVLDRVQRFMLLITDAGSVRLVESHGVTNLTIERDAHRMGLEIANEVSLVMIVGILNEVTGKKIRPVLVTFKHDVRSVQAFEQFFECEVMFNQPHCSIHFKTADIDVHTIKADKSIHQFLVERMGEEMRGIHTNTDKLMGEIHKLMEEALPSGIPSIIQVADYLGMSARTLKRRLADKNLTFRDFVQSIQREIAINLIKSTPQTMAEIAFQTGFSEQSAFNRALKRWTGKSPVDYKNTF
ncbi:MAG: AraC family transcriptional regulator ligand-binding domain-containing protein [Cyclobacteriaceae bacterium]